MNDRHYKEVQSKYHDTWQRYRKSLAGVLIFLFAFGIRLFYLDTVVIDRPIRADALKYLGYAVNLIHHGVYSQTLKPHPLPDAQVSPGYPLFLAGIFKTSPKFEMVYQRQGDTELIPKISENTVENFNIAYIKVLVIQALLGGLTAMISFFTGLFFLPFWAAVGAGGLTALSPHLITLGSYILTETLFTFLMMTSLVILMPGIKYGKSLFFLPASVIMGFASLVRPVLLLFPVFILSLVFFYWKPSSRVRISFFLLLGIALVWSPWMIWSMHTPPSSEKPGLALSAFALGMYPDLIYKDPRYQGFPYSDPENTIDKQLSTDIKFALKTLWKNTLESPVTYIRWYVWGKPLMFWSWDILVGQDDIYIYPVKTSLYETHSIAKATRFGMRILHPVLLIMAFLGFIILLIQARSEPENKNTQVMGWLIFLFMLYFTLVHTLLAPLPRYSIPLRPVLYLGAFIPWVYLWKKVGRRK